MRPIVCVTLALTALTAASTSALAQSEKKPEQRRPVAVSAERFAQPAAYVESGHGYSERARRISDCLATYPNYNWRTDRIQVRPGVTRRCEL
ncbi:hypothetical protein [Phenylobacterium deserti]|nr:hypothetical protein [Phenylobacterium deserti]